MIEVYKVEFQEGGKAKGGIGDEDGLNPGYALRGSMEMFSLLELSITDPSISWKIK